MLLESQAFAPEKLEELSGGDDFDIDFDKDEKKKNAERKSSFNFGTDSPIENKKFNFDTKYSNISLGSEIKKIEQNDYPNFDEVNNTNANINNTKINQNDSNMFHFEFGEESAKKQERKQSKDKESFNFNTSVNQKDGDEWDF